VFSFIQLDLRANIGVRRFFPFGWSADARMTAMLTNTTETGGPGPPYVPSTGIHDA